eukprot:NODE_283_length_1711_cov_116.760870.p7 GENE.NODE_283_length_1711_cov_116.760870~~NODE_283_length_1711_cov_116.760870.p7  ORF type:complete len:69 (+),score=1.90 NODE_283_length_1711_cov_116.760870:492-698(+)
MLARPKRASYKQKMRDGGMFPRTPHDMSTIKQPPWAEDSCAAQYIAACTKMHQALCAQTHGLAPKPNC